MLNLSLCVRMCVCCTGPGFSFCQADCVCCGLLLQHQCANSRISFIFQPPWTSGGFGHTIPLPHELKHTHTHTHTPKYPSLLPLPFHFTPPRWSGSFTGTRRSLFRFYSTYLLFRQIMPKVKRCGDVFCFLS